MQLRCEKETAEEKNGENEIAFCDSFTVWYSIQITHSFNPINSVHTLDWVGILFLFSLAPWFDYILSTWLRLAGAVANSQTVEWTESTDCSNKFDVGWHLCDWRINKVSSSQIKFSFGFLCCVRVRAWECVMDSTTFYRSIKWIQIEFKWVMEHFFALSLALFSASLFHRQYPFCLFPRMANLLFFCCCCFLRHI